jgi:hypothetical protein
MTPKVSTSKPPLFRLRILGLNCVLTWISIHWAKKDLTSGYDIQRCSRVLCLFSIFASMSGHFYRLVSLFLTRLCFRPIFTLYVPFSHFTKFFFSHFSLIFYLWQKFWHKRNDLCTREREAGKKKRKKNMCEEKLDRGQRNSRPRKRWRRLRFNSIWSLAKGVCKDTCSVESDVCIFAYNFGVSCNDSGSFWAARSNLGNGQKIFNLPVFHFRVIG